MSSSSHPPTKLTVLISGSGTNLQALIDATTSSPPTLPNTIITHVISNKKNAYGLDRARSAGIKTSYHNLVAGHYLKSGEKDPEAIKAGREKYDADLAALILSDGPDLIVCVSLPIFRPVMRIEANRCRRAGCTFYLPPSSRPWKRNTSR